MRVTIPFNDAFPQYRLEVITPVGVQTMTVDDSHRVVEVALPVGVNEDDVEVCGYPLTRQGVLPPGCSSTVIKSCVKRPVERPVERPVSSRTDSSKKSFFVGGVDDKRAQEA